MLADKKKQLAHRLETSDIDKRRALRKLQEALDFARGMGLVATIDNVPNPLRSFRMGATVQVINVRPNRRQYTETMDLEKEIQELENDQG